MVAVWALLLVACCAPASTSQEQRHAVVTKFREGLDLAGKLLGLDTAQGVANLVSSSLMQSRPRAGPGGLFSGFFRLLGLDSTKLGAIALNAIVFIAQLISSALVPPRPRENEPEGSPLSWLLDNPTVQLRDLLTGAQDDRLPERLERSIRERHTDDVSGCVQLLVCKSAPFVRGMQRAVRALLRGESAGLGRLTPLQRMYHDLPSAREFAEHGDECEDRLPACRILPPL